jgi:hypothetical protein
VSAGLFVGNDDKSHVPLGTPIKKLQIAAIYPKPVTLRKCLDMIFLPSFSSELAAHFGMPFVSNKDEEYR